MLTDRVIDDVLDDEFSGLRRGSGRPRPVDVSTGPVEHTTDEPVAKGRNRHKDSADRDRPADHGSRHNQSVNRFNPRPIIVSGPAREAGAVLSVEPVDPEQLDWYVVLEGGTQEEPSRVFAGHEAQFLVTLVNVQESQVVSVAWTLPNFPDVFGAYDVANQPNDPTTAQSESYGEVLSCDTPPEVPPVLELSCIWGPVNKVVSASVTVTVDLGDGNIESDSDTSYYDIDEPILIDGSVDHAGDFPKASKCATGTDRITFGCLDVGLPVSGTLVENPDGPPGVWIKPVVARVDGNDNLILPDGDLYFIQLANDQAKVTDVFGNTKQRNTGAFVMDAPAPQWGYPLSQNLPRHNETVDGMFGEGSGGMYCPTPRNLTPPHAYCRMTDAPSVEPQDQHVRVERTFHAQTTLMYTPVDPMHSVPIARVDWFFKVTAERAANGEWVVLAAATDHFVPSAMTPTDDWPEWEKQINDFPLA